MSYPRASAHGGVDGAVRRAHARHDRGRERGNEGSARVVAGRARCRRHVRRSGERPRGRGEERRQQSVNVRCWFFIFFSFFLFTLTVESGRGSFCCEQGTRRHTNKRVALALTTRLATAQALRGRRFRWNSDHNSYTNSVRGSLRPPNNLWSRDFLYPFKGVVIAHRKERK